MFKSSPSHFTSVAFHIHFYYSRSLEVSMETLLTIPVLLVGALVVDAIRDILKSHSSLRGARAEREAEWRFDEWRYRNPGVYLSLSDEGKALLRAWIKALDWYEKTHPWVDCRSRRAYIMSFFDDFPPKSPNEAPCNGCPEGHPFFKLFLEIFSQKHQLAFSNKWCLIDF